MKADLELKEESFALSKMLADLEIEKIKNNSQQEITKISNNSREVIPGTLFVAIKGYQTDGHQYINEAVNNGAVAVLGETDLMLPEEITYIKVENSRKALAQLGNKFFLYPDQNLDLIGVTGSAGKTTTSCMMDNIFGQVTPATGLIGTLYTKIGSQIYDNPKGCTTPDAITLNQSLAQMADEGINYVSMEVSSHALKLDRVTGLEFEVAVFTNLSYDHLNFHQDITDYYKSKEILFSQLSTDKFAILNKDDNYYQKFKDSTVAQTYSYAIREDADVTAEEVEFSGKGLAFTLNINRQLKTRQGNLIDPTSLQIELGLIGEQNIYNAMAAFLGALVLDIPLQKIKAGLESFSGIKRRMELCYNKDFVVIDDFAHNPISLEANFKTLQKFDYNKLIIVHFLKGKRGVQANLLNGQLIAQWSDKINLTKVITTRAEGEVIAKNKVLATEEAAFNEKIAEAEIELINTEYLEEAIKEGLNSVATGDILLLLGGPGLNRAQSIINEKLADYN